MDKDKYKDKPNLNEDEAADFLNVSKHALRKWRAQRKLAFAKLGDRVIFRRCDLEKFLELNMVKARHLSN